MSIHTQADQGRHPRDDLLFVLVHGAAHSAGVWAPLLPHLDLPAIVIELPGRGSSATDLRRLKLSAFVSEIMTVIAKLASERVILVGHSAAGALLPAVAAQTPDRIQHLVFISSVIPRGGMSAASTLPRGLRAVFRLWVGRGGALKIPSPVARWMFCNDLDPDQTAFVMRQLCAEAPSLVLSPVPCYVVPPELRRTYIVLRRDHALPLRFQQRQIRHLGPTAVVHLDAGHNAFVSQPQAVAAILNRIAAEEHPDPAL